MIDTHAHLFYKDFAGQLDEVLDRARAAGVEAIICVGLDLASSETAIALAEKYPFIWATAGVHPHDAGEAPDGYLLQLEQLASHPRVVAIGEMGLDFYRNHSPAETQQRVFREQLELAKSLDLPVVVHNREADEALYAALTSARHSRGVVHCFSSAVPFARQILDFGLEISFTGTVTFGKNHNAAVLEAVGLGHVMVETDCPYLAPTPKRGKTNEPSYLRHTVAAIAEICGTTAEAVGEITTANARRLFGLPDSASGHG